MVGITLSSYQTPNMKTSRRWHYGDHSKVQSQVLGVEGVKCGVHFVNFLGSSLFSRAWTRSLDVPKTWTGSLTSCGRGSAHHSSSTSHLVDNQTWITLEQGTLSGWENMNTTACSIADVSWLFSPCALKLSPSVSTLQNQIFGLNQKQISRAQIEVFLSFITSLSTFPWKYLLCLLW